MHKIIQRGLVILVFLVPLVFSHATTEVYGLMKWAVLELGVLALLVLWLMDVLLFKENPLQAEPLNRTGLLGWAVLSFFAVSLLSLAKATNKYEGVASIYQLGAGIGLFFLILNNVKNKKEVNEILMAMVLSAVAACFFSLYEIHGIKLNLSRLAYTSTFGNPIFFAQYLTLAIPVSLSLCFSGEPATTLADSGRFNIFKGVYSHRIFFGFCALFMLVFVILTRSRGAYLGVCIAFLYAYIKLLPYCPKKIKKALIIITVVSLFAATLGISLSKGENTKFRNLMRVYVWKSTINMVRDHPVLGVGTGNFKVIYPLYRSLQEREVTPKGVTYTKAHNDFLQVWAETGTLGLICFLWILLSIVFLKTGNHRRGESLFPEVWPIRLGLYAAMITLLSQAFFNPALSVPTSAMGFWLLLGLVAIS